MRMSVALQKKYPQCARYVKYYLPRVIHVPVIVKAIERCGELSRSQLRTALAWGTDPTIEVAVFQHCAQYVLIPGNNVIQLEKRVMVNHEAGRGLLTTGSGKTVYALGVNILHELVHWGDFKDGTLRPGESGDEFEMLVYRANLGC